MIEFAKNLNASIKIIELFSENSSKIVTLNEIKDIFLNFGFKVFEEHHHKLVLFDGETKIIISKIFCAAAHNRYNPNGFLRMKLSTMILIHFQKRNKWQLTH